MRWLGLFPAVTLGLALGSAPADAQDLAPGVLPKLTPEQQVSRLQVNLVGLAVTSALPLADGQAAHAQAEWIPLAGDRVPIAAFPKAPAHMHLYDGRAVWVERNLIWEAPFGLADGGLTGEPAPLSSDPAVEARYAADGSVLYISGDGLRLRRPDGDTISPSSPAPPASGSSLRPPSGCRC
jgi:hypothetical protein